MTDEHQKKLETEGNASAATGASGGGSLGNERGAPVTGGAPENGERSSGDVHPTPDAISGGGNSAARSAQTADEDPASRSADEDDGGSAAR